MRSILRGKIRVTLGRERQLKPKAPGEPLSRFRGEPLIMIAHESPDAPHPGEMPLNFHGPAFQSGFPLPQELPVLVKMSSVGIVFGGVVAQQAQVNEIGGQRQKFEGGEISLIERAGISPDPADAIILQQADDVGAMPAGMSKLDGETKVARQEFKKGAQGGLAILRSERGRELNEENVQFCGQRFNRAQEGGQLGGAIVQLARVRDFAGQLAGEAESGRRHFHPAQGGFLRGRAVKSGVDFHGGKITGIKLEPAGLGQVRRIKGVAPVLERPGTGAHSYFLLIRQVQGVGNRVGDAGKNTLKTGDGYRVNRLLARAA